jgi:hypothetical protein
MLDCMWLTMQVEQAQQQLLQMDQLLLGLQQQAVVIHLPQQQQQQGVALLHNTCKASEQQQQQQHCLELGMHLQRIAGEVVSSLRQRCLDAAKPGEMRGVLFLHPLYACV